MSSPLQLLADNLRQFLDRSAPLSDENDLVLMAVSGERLRRVLGDPSGEEAGAATEADRNEAQALLARYDERLRSGEAPPAERIPTEIEDALSHLKALAKVEGTRRDAEELSLAGDRLAEALWVAAAACRGGTLPEASLRALALQARTTIADLAPRLPELWDRAVVRLATYGVDEDCQFIDDWLEELAHLAPSRAALHLAPPRPSQARIERVTKRAVAGLQRRLHEAKQPTSVSWDTATWGPLVAQAQRQARDLMAGIDPDLQAILHQLRPVPVHRPQAASAAAGDEASTRTRWKAKEGEWFAFIDWPRAHEATDDAVVELQMYAVPTDALGVILGDLPSRIEFLADERVVARFRLGDLRPRFEQGVPPLALVVGDSHRLVWALPEPPVEPT